MKFPAVFRVRQHFQGPAVEDIAQRVRDELGRWQWDSVVRPGQTVAITAGSRGIANLAEILRAAVGVLKAWGAEPFIVPAMGSHGGATAEGQRALLARYGVTAERCGCPIRSSMDTVQVCQAREGFTVHFDRAAFEADHVLVVNRVKPHTGFSGPIQSGLMKMLLIGLGKHAGAQVYHRAIKDFSFSQILHSVASEVIERCGILGGLAILENGREQTAWIEAIPARNFTQREPELLQMAEQWMARLPFDSADVLIVDQIGKDISGTGMDTNVIGRKDAEHGEPPSPGPRIRRVIVRGLTPGTAGNACGIGFADFALTRAVEQMQLHSTLENCLTAGHPEAGRVPFHFPTDSEVLAAASRTLGLVAPEDMRLMWIHHTLDLSEVECSMSYWPEVTERGLEVAMPPRPLPLDSDGMLPDWKDVATAACPS